jgi:hypothetical protein
MPKQMIKQATKNMKEKNFQGYDIGVRFHPELNNGMFTFQNYGGKT